MDLLSIYDSPIFTLKDYYNSFYKKIKYKFKYICENLY